MKEKVIIVALVFIYTSISTSTIKEFDKNSFKNNYEITVAEDFWDYISRFYVNN